MWCRAATQHKSNAFLEDYRKLVVMEDIGQAWLDMSYDEQMAISKLNVNFIPQKSQYSLCISLNPSQKIAIRGDGKSPDQKVIDMQLQAANLVYIFDVIIRSVTANKSGRLTVETSFLPLNSQASSYKVHSREITYKSSKGEQQFLNARHPLDLLFIYTIYYQNISKDIKVIERTSFPL